MSPDNKVRKCGREKKQEREREKTSFSLSYEFSVSVYFAASSPETTLAMRKGETANGPYLTWHGTLNAAFQRAN